MAIDFAAVYPAACTNAAWQKKKSITDKAKKATKKTGLGEALLKAEAAYKKVDFNKMVVAECAPPPMRKWRSAEQIEQAKSLAQTYHAKTVLPLAELLVRTSKVAYNTAQIPELSKTSQAAAKAISKQLLDHAALLRNIKLNDFDKEAKNFREKLEFVNGFFVRKLGELENKLNALEKSPTIATWNKIDVKNAFRSLGNTLGNDVKYKNVWPTWEPWDGMHYDADPRLQKSSGIEVEKEVILDIIKQTRPELAKLKRLANK